jgi:hypothetical protein
MVSSGLLRRVALVRTQKTPFFRTLNICPEQNLTYNRTYSKNFNQKCCLHIPLSAVRILYCNTVAKFSLVLQVLLPRSLCSQLVVLTFVFLILSLPFRACLLLRKRVHFFVVLSSAHNEEIITRLRILLLFSFVSWTAPRTLALSVGGVKAWVVVTNDAAIRSC